MPWKNDLSILYEWQVVQTRLPIQHNLTFQKEKKRLTRKKLTFLLDKRTLSLNVIIFWRSECKVCKAGKVRIWSVKEIIQPYGFPQLSGN